LKMGKGGRGGMFAQSGEAARRYQRDWKNDGTVTRETCQRARVNI
jgi:hypothetical protein